MEAFTWHIGYEVQDFTQYRGSLDPFRPSKEARQSNGMSFNDFHFPIYNSDSHNVICIQNIMTNTKIFTTDQLERGLQLLKDPRDAKVLRLHYGLAGETPRTLQKIGDMLKISRERVRQLENRALRKLRHPKNLKNLLKEGEQ